MYACLSLQKCWCLCRCGLAEGDRSDGSSVSLDSSPAGCSPCSGHPPARPAIAARMLLSESAVHMVPSRPSAPEHSLGHSYATTNSVGVLLFTRKGLLPQPLMELVGPYNPQLYQRANGRTETFGQQHRSGKPATQVPHHSGRRAGRAAPAGTLSLHRQCLPSPPQP